jgi:hypothetical protein
MLPDADHRISGTCRSDQDGDSRRDDDQARTAPQ